MKCYYIILLLLAFSGFFYFLMTKRQSSDCLKGTIIILNGPSASGKSSIQKNIQERFQNFYLRVGIDNFFDALLPNPAITGPEQFTKHGELIRRVIFSNDTEGNPIISLEVGPAGQRVINGMHRAIAAYALTGNNVVVDYILYDLDWLQDLINVLKGHRVYFVGITLPLEVLEEREKSRGTSPVGHARSHYHTVHAHGVYDIELDTSKLTSEECALKIQEYIDQHPEPQAFEQLRKTFNKQETIKMLDINLKKLYPINLTTSNMPG